MRLVTPFKIQPRKFTIQKSGDKGRVMTLMRSLQCRTVMDKKSLSLLFPLLSLLYYNEVPLARRLAPFMDSFVVSSEGVIKLLKRLNLSKALVPD